MLATTLLAATIIHEDRFKWDYPPTWVWTFVYGVRAAGDPVPGARQRRVAEPLPPADPRPAAAARRCRASSASALLVGAVALYVAPVELGEDWLWALTPLLGRAVAAWYALFGTMLLTFAVGLRRPFEGLIGYATLACWCVLLLRAAGAALGRRDAARAGGCALMVALLALARRTALRSAWPRAQRNALGGRRWRRAGERASAPARATACSRVIGSRNAGIASSAERTTAERSRIPSRDLGSRRKMRGQAHGCPWRPPVRGRPHWSGYPPRGRPQRRRRPRRGPSVALEARKASDRAGDHGGDRRRGQAEPVGREHEPDQRVLAAAQHQAENTAEDDSSTAIAGPPDAASARRSASSHGSASSSAITHATSAAGTRKRPRSVP